MRLGLSVERSDIAIATVGRGLLCAASRDPDTPKAVIVVLTGIANLPDDWMSMVRLLVYSNPFDICKFERSKKEGLCGSPEVSRAY